MANIAVAVGEAVAQRRKSGAAGRTTERVIAPGDGWRVADVLCSCGPQDKSFEERHPDYEIAVVMAGTFRYRSGSGTAVMTPGSLLLGNRHQCYECGHEHSEGDRCVLFSYSAEYFERLATDAGVGRGFTIPRLPPLRALSPLVARASAGTLGTHDISWAELSLNLAAQSLACSAGVSSTRGLPLNAEARVTRIVRAIERHPQEHLTLSRMARLARMSPYHFLRTFERVAGVTPHQFMRRTRLRLAATRLLAEPSRVLDVAIESGFGDVSNFNKAFRMEFGVSPRAFRRQK